MHSHTQWESHTTLYIRGWKVMPRIMDHANPNMCKQLRHLFCTNLLMRSDYDCYDFWRVTLQWYLNKHLSENIFHRSIASMSNSSTFVLSTLPKPESRVHSYIMYSCHNSLMSNFPSFWGSTQTIFDRHMVTKIGKSLSQPLQCSIRVFINSLLVGIRHAEE